MRLSHDPLSKAVAIILAGTGLMLAQAGAPQTPAGGRGRRGGTFNAEPQVISLWEGTAPGSLGDTPADRPGMTFYRAGRGASGTAVIIAPGGAYGALAMSYEGVQEAYWFNAMGVAAFVLQYRVGPRYHHPVELGDAQR